MMADDDEVSTKVLDANRQKHKEMMSSLAVMESTEKKYQKAKSMMQPYRGTTRPY